MKNTQLTGLNLLFTYERRCKQAAQRWIEQNPDNSLESMNFNNCSNFWARFIARQFQVEIEDMLAVAQTL